MRNGLLLNIPLNGTLRLTTPHLNKGCSYGVSLKLSFIKTITWRTTGSNPLYPSSYSFPYLSYLLHNLMSKELFGEASKCRSKKKKQEARRKKKIEQEKWRKWGLRDAPPRRGWEVIALPLPLPSSQEIIKNWCFALSDVTQSKQINLEFWKKRARSSASSIQYRVLKKESKILG